ncbi:MULTISPECIES: O-antigen ligase family protein [unclassified Psychrobacter]|uniref:O-antigen ligase family protein n=1 Tax=unclassified Psychrobacter TaxID=196806 RepID=UPI0018F79E05|nr:MULTISPECIES: O-antigen ligase family protein [unclassified Psychrobacter]
MKIKKKGVLAFLVSLNAFLLTSTLYSNIDFIVYITFAILFFTLILLGRFRSINKAQLIFLSLLVSFVLSLLASIDISSSIIPTIFFIFLIFYSISLSRSIETLDDIERFMFYALMGFILFNIRNLTAPSSTLRFVGVVGQPNALGLVSATSLVLGISYLYLFSNYRNISKFVALSVILSSSILVVLAGSRGAIVAVLTAFSYLILKNIKYNIKITLGLIISFILLINIFQQQIVESPLYSRVLAIPAAIGLEAPNTDIDIKYRSASDDIRIDIANTAIKGFLDKPILGNGLNTFQYYSDFVYTHSTVLEVLFTLGLFGGFIFLFIIFLSLKVKSKGEDVLLDRFFVIKNFILIYYIVTALSIPNFQNKSQIIIYVFIIYVVEILYKNKSLNKF